MTYVKSNILEIVLASPNVISISICPGISQEFIMVKKDNQNIHSWSMVITKAVMGVGVSSFHGWQLGQIQGQHWFPKETFHSLPLTFFFFFSLDELWSHSLSGGSSKKSKLYLNKHLAFGSAS